MQWVLTFVPITKPTINLANNQNLLACDTLSLSATATGAYPPFSYSWSPFISGQSHLNQVLNVSGIYSQTIYTVIVTDSIGCSNTDSVIVTPQLTYPIAPHASLNGCEVSCNIIPNCNYQWVYNNGMYYPYGKFDTLQNATSPSYSADSTGYYYVIVSSALYPACSFRSDTIYKSPYQGQTICITTLDSTNTYNLIVWEKTQGSGIKNFMIYKLSDSTSQYVLLGEQPFNHFSTFLDTTSRPSQYSSSYKISIVDSCGDESSLSPTHTTILLSANLGTGNTVNLSWNPYVGFTYNNFEIWRSSNGGNMSLLATIANNTYAYIDNNPPSQPNYQVQITNPNGCTPTRSLFDYSTVRSNIVNPTLSSGIRNISNSGGVMNVYPNPSDGNINVIIEGNMNISARLIVIDVLGRLIKEQPVDIKRGSNAINLDLSASNGTYFIELIDQSNTLIDKRVVILQ